MVMGEGLKTGTRDGPLPKIMVTRDVHKMNDADSRRHWAAEKIQVKLLTTDDKYRSHVLCQQIKAFEDKIYLCDETFNTDMMYQMFKELIKRTKSSADVCTLAGLRQAFRMEARRLTMRNRNKKPGFSKTEPDHMMQYFAWFFDYVKYLRELRANFIERIFNPLFKYFFETGSSGPDKERSLDSSMSLSNFSLASYRSADTNVSRISKVSGTSGTSGTSEMSSVSSWSLGISDTESEISSTDDIHETRQKMLSRAALHLLGREFRDIRNLYDTSELERIAQRLSFLKEQIDYLLDNEDKISFEMFSQDSENAVHHLKFKNIRTHCLMRLLPDIVIKCKKAAWLAKRWLKLDDSKTKDINRKLNKLASLEGQLSKRLSVLSKDVQKHEHELETQLTELQKLLKLEERSNELQLAVMTADDKHTSLKADLDKLQLEKKELTTNAKSAAKNGRHADYTNYKTMYERNRLQRYVLERQLATLSYHQTLIAHDMHVELEVRPNLIHFTNDVQDRCEELEKLLDKERSEKRTLEAALIPITGDKGIVSDRIRGSQISTPTRNNFMPDYLQLESGQLSPSHQAFYTQTFKDPTVLQQKLDKFSTHRPEADDVGQDSPQASPRSQAMYVRTVRDSTERKITFDLDANENYEITSDWS